MSHDCCNTSLSVVAIMMSSSYLPQFLHQRLSLLTIAAHVVIIIRVKDYVLHDEKLNRNKGASTSKSSTSTAGTRWLIDDKVCWCSTVWYGLHCTCTLKYHSWKQWLKMNSWHNPIGLLGSYLTWIHLCRVHRFIQNRANLCTLYRCIHVK